MDELTNVEKDLALMVNNRRVIMDNMVSDEVLTEPIPEPYTDGISIPEDAANSYEEFECTSLVNDLILLDLDIYTLLLKVEVLNKLLETLNKRSKYTIDELKEYYNIKVEMILATFKVDLCTVFNIDSADYRCELNGLENDLESFTINLEEER